MLQQLRLEKGLSQSQLAKASGVTIHAIHKIENGQRNIRTAQALTAYKLAKALGVSVGKLIGEEE